MQAEVGCRSVYLWCCQRLNCSTHSNRQACGPDVALMVVALQKSTLRKSKRLQHSNHACMTGVIRIWIGRAVFVKMTALSSSACIPYAQPRVCYLKAQGNRRCPQRRGVFTLTVRGSFAESGSTESSATFQVRSKRPHSS